MATFRASPLEGRVCQLPNVMFVFSNYSRQPTGIGMTSTCLMQANWQSLSIWLAFLTLSRPIPGRLHRILFAATAPPSSSTLTPSSLRSLPHSASNARHPAACSLPQPRPQCHQIFINNGISVRQTASFNSFYLFANFPKQNNKNYIKSKKTPIDRRSVRFYYASLSFGNKISINNSFLVIFF